MNENKTVLEGRLILAAKINALNRNLEEVKSALDSKAISKELRVTVRNLFGALIENYKTDLQRQQNLLADSGDLFGPWESFERIHNECQALFGECLAFLEGSLFRTVGLDHDICEFADSLLGELSKAAVTSYSRFTIPASKELMSNMTDIIRVRFPEFSCWNLPIIAHEFGHFIATKDSEISQVLFQEIIDQEGEIFQNEREQRYIKDHLHECFADIFATYSLGPAFACACILLNFFPENESSEDKHPQHPSNDKRVYLILKALEEMNEFDRDKAQNYIDRPVIDNLREKWKNLLESSGYLTSLSESTVKQLDKRFQKISLVLKRKFPLVRYTREDWNRTFILALDIPKVQEENINSLIQKQDKLTIVLNAGWLCRLQHWGNRTLEEQYNQKIFKLCNQIMHHK